MLHDHDWPARYAARIATRPSTFVVQPTKFCNLDCTYCYLRDRDQRSHMPVEVARAAARSAAQVVREDGSQPLGIVWHAGEPMALGVRRFTSLLAPFQPLLEAGLLRHYMQTNVTLVTDEWCELLLEHDFRIGVSIDGPAALNSQRINRRGQPAFDRIMKGIDRLRSRSIPFSAIAVVNQDSIDQPQVLLDFLSDLGCESIGLNMEEAEDVKTKRRPPIREQAIEFWRRAIAWSRCHPDGATIRELDRLGDYLHLVRSGQRARWQERRIDPIPTISVSGDVVLLSPELADTTAPTYEDFRAGNVLEESIPAILDRAHRLRYVREFLTGLDECEATCAFFDFCRGAQAGNRYFENGSLATTETNHCRVSQQALVMALSDTARKEYAA
ncbi:cyclophane-forming radical SAM peptide maturase AmcB [Streptomyces silvisoli]|uniref:Radical SAM protein n=1 Tax=Streptomyces silvisoli TaxID=3034235 RepID=A0ABT5ZRX0_9ACTN|nr:cyclophane-forming radical SAM peptide maturase AmcB [Streptomyces silvisoli]MDF3292269.1 radical SAM protein [Streptomyces silvisoli]